MRFVTFADLAGDMSNFTKVLDTIPEGEKFTETELSMLDDIHYAALRLAEIVEIIMEDPTGR